MYQLSRVQLRELKYMIHCFLVFEVRMNDSMMSGLGSVEIVENVDDVDTNENVTEFRALGSRDLVWVKVNVSSYVRSGSGYNIKHNGKPRWLHESNVRKFQRLDNE